MLAYERLQSDRTANTDKDLVDIENRNRLRAEAGLPLLDARAEGDATGKRP